VPLTSLSKEQQSAFSARLKEFQMKPEQVVKQVNSKTHKGPIVLSADPAVSTIPPHIVTLTSLDEAKRLAGNEDELFENGLMQNAHEALPEWPAALNDKDRTELTPEQNRLINKAHTAYIYGHSKLVSSYKAIIEKLNYPVQVATFAIEELCIDKTNSPFIVKDPAGLNVGTLTICEGGYIQTESNTSITAQVMIKSDKTSCPQ